MEILCPMVMYSHRKSVSLIHQTHTLSFHWMKETSWGDGTGLEAEECRAKAGRFNEVFIGGTIGLDRPNRCDELDKVDMEADKEEGFVCAILDVADKPRAMSGLEICECVLVESVCFFSSSLT